MTLIEKTNKVKELSLAIKANFIELGKHLKDIRDNRIFEEKYSNFIEYLNSEDFQFCERMAFNLIKVFEEYGQLQRVAVSLPLRTLIQLAYISDRQVRNDLEKEAVTVYQKKEGITNFYKKVKRTAQRTNTTVVKGDSPAFKCERQLKQLLNDIKEFIQTREYLVQRLAEGKIFASKYPENQIIQGIIKEIENYQL
jgi:hypothetical protein